MSVFRICDTLYVCSHTGLGESLRIKPVYSIDSNDVLHKVQNSPILCVHKDLMVSENIGKGGFIIQGSMSGRHPKEAFRDVMRMIFCNFNVYQMNERSLIGFDDSSVSVEVDTGTGKISENFESALSDKEISDAVTLESLRGTLMNMGILDFSSNVFESVVEIDRPLCVYMKTDPFRDITILSEGTPVSLEEYKNGCVGISADGELFWTPIESKSVWDSDVRGRIDDFKKTIQKDAWGHGV